MGDSLRIQVSLVLLLIDDFMDKIITSPAVRVSVEEAGKVIRKAEGFYVFTNLSSFVVRVTAEGAWYRKEERVVDLRLLDKSEPVVRIRMRPNRCYTEVSTNVPLMAEMPENTRFFAFYEDGNDYKRLLEDYEKDGEFIRLHQGEKEELEGKMCCITGKNGSHESLCLSRAVDKDKGIYLLGKKPDSGYKKVGTRVYPAVFAESKAEGKYFVLLKSYGEKEISYTCMIEQGKKRTERKIKLKAGRENHEDFRDIHS